MPKITPFLWFNGQAEEAAKFYVSVFKNSRILSESRYGETGPGKPGTVMVVSFELDGAEFTALNGGPQFTFTPATSFVVHCGPQEEVDWFWNRLSAGGHTDQCGWLTDKFGVTWQVVPDVLLELMGDRDPAKAQRVMQAMLKMTKIDIKKLQEAHAGR